MSGEDAIGSLTIRYLPGSVKETALRARQRLPATLRQAYPCRAARAAPPAVPESLPSNPITRQFSNDPWGSGLLVIAIVLGSNARTIGSFFIDSPAILDYLVALTIMVAMVQPMMSIEFTLGGALRGAGDTRSPARIMAVGIVFGRVMLTAIFYFADLSVYWVYAALIADYVIKSVMYLYIFRQGHWKTAFERGQQAASAQA